MFARIDPRSIPRGLFRRNAGQEFFRFLSGVGKHPDASGIAALLQELQSEFTAGNDRRKSFGGGFAQTGIRLHLRLRRGEQVEVRRQGRMAPCISENHVSGIADFFEADSALLRSETPQLLRTHAFSCILPSFVRTRMVPGNAPVR